MTAPVEAGSLSALTTLASNPPRYPRNPAHEARDALVLYIARVPGSKDIFLTTIKPRQKTVTAEDVTSSLYYIHVNQPQDEELLKAAKQPLQNKKLPETPGSASVDEGSHVLRKPLPPNPWLSLQDPPVNPPKTYPAYHVPGYPPNGLLKVDRKPLQSLSDISAVTETATTDVQKHSMLASQYQPTQRHVLGPRPLGSSRLSPDGLLPGGENVPPTQRIERKPVLPLRPAEDVSLEDLSRIRRRSDNPRKPPAEFRSQNSGTEVYNWHEPFDPSTSRGFDAVDYSRQSESDTVRSGVASLVLIRRDPSSGGQWNVGNITIIADSDGSGGASEPSRSPMSYVKPKQPSHIIEVEITNPGYGRFMPPKRPPIYPSPPSEGRISLGEGRVDARWKDFAYQNGAGSSVVQNKSTSDGEGNMCFKREVWAEGSNFWDRTMRKKRTESTDSRAAITTSANTVMDPFENGRPDLDAINGRRKSEFSTSITKPAASKGGSYVFLSPWDGRCEFFTGSGGRSLKCKHTPLSAPGFPPHRSALVSELRFNLPTSSVLSNSSSSNVANQTPVSSASSLSAAGSSNGSKRSSLFSSAGLKKHLRPSGHRHSKSMLAVPTVSVNDEKDDNRLFRSDDEYTENVSDLERGFHGLLSLGREKAGGGSGGKRAKLGKLIVDDEGLKMLDLVVAVNVGLWWRAWGRIGAVYE